MSPSSPNGEPPFQPVILGGDIGVYAMARSLHEAYGVRSVVVSSTAAGPIAASRIIENVLTPPDSGPQGIVDTLLTVAARTTAARPGVRLLLLANTDWLVRLVVQHRAVLEQHYLVPFLGESLLDRLSDKAAFTELCGELGIAVPETVVQDFAGADAPGWRPAPVDLGFPLIAKAASSADYQDVSFAGKRKVYEISSAEELAELFETLRAAGFRGRFVVQELIPGDDTWMRSITAYADTSGRVTLLCSAQVLLEEHTPTALGNPAAMVTTRYDDMLEQARTLLERTGYVGFANFDVKVDPRDGSARFFEVNPRIGRNNYYVTAAGTNPFRLLVEDVVRGRRLEPVVVDDTVLYSILPHRLLLRYVVDPALAARVRGLIRARRAVHPLRNPRDRGLRRTLYVWTAMANQVRKFRRHYPRVSGTGF